MSGKNPSLTVTNNLKIRVLSKSRRKRGWIDNEISFAIGEMPEKS